MKTFYHGTIARRVESIKKEGLVPEHGGVFLTPQYDFACEWGTAVLLVELPDDFPVHFKGKERGYEEYYATEKIPARYIREVEIPVEIPLTPKQIQVVYNRFIDMGYEWVTMKGGGTEKLIPADPRLRQKGPATLVILKSRLAEALSILDSAVDITRDWTYEPAGRAEHYATIKLYEKVKVALAEPKTKETPLEKWEREAKTRNHRFGR